MAAITASTSMAALAKPAATHAAAQRKPVRSIRTLPSLVRASASLPRKAAWAAVRTTKPRPFSFAVSAMAEAVEEPETAPTTAEAVPAEAAPAEVEAAAEAAPAEVEAAPGKADKAERRPRRTVSVKMEDIAEGNTYPGTVTSVQTYGAFINFGAKNDGLVHISELQEGYVENVGDVVTNGQKVEVRVISIDKEKNRVALSMKPEGYVYVASEPSDEADGNVEVGEDGRPVRKGKVATRSRKPAGGGGRSEAPPPVKKGEKYQGVVKSLLPFGAFVELKIEGVEGVQGLLHVSEISETRINNPSEVLTEGQEVEVRIQDIKGSKLNLSMREQVDIAEMNAAANLDLGDSATALEMALKRAGLSREMFPEGEAAPAAAEAAPAAAEAAPAAETAPEPVKEEAAPEPEPVVAAEAVPEPAAAAEAPAAPAGEADSAVSSGL